MRAAALIAIGACAASRRVLAPYLRSSRSLAALHAAAAYKERDVLHHVDALADAPDAPDRVPPHLNYIHSALAMRRDGADGKKGRGWFATSRIAAGTILVVEPTVLPTVPPQRDATEEGTLPLLRAVAQALQAGGSRAEAMREYLACLCPLEGDGHGRSADDGDDDGDGGGGDGHGDGDGGGGNDEGPRCATRSRRRTRRASAARTA